MIKQPRFVEVKVPRTRIGSVYVSITANGVINFYSGTFDRYDIGKFSHCLLLLDKQQKLLGLQLLESGMRDGALPVVPHKSGRTAAVYARRFFELNPDIDLKAVRGKFIPEQYSDAERKNVLVLDLEKKIDVKKRSR